MAASDWISVGALGSAFSSGSNALAESTGLLGRRLRLHFENGTVTEYRFGSASRLEVSMLEDGIAQVAGTDSLEYSATEIRPDLFFVTLLEHPRSLAAGALLLDLPAGACTWVRGRLPTWEEACTPFVERIAAGEELTGVDVQFIAGAIDGPITAATPRHAETLELVGRRVEYTYSPTERYEHIYLNERFYTWHCLAGSERGLADTDRCHYRKLGPDLYLFVWREKIVPTLGIVVVDLLQKKTTGRIAGYEGFDFGKVTSFPVGAHLRVLGDARS